ncbi:MAG: putative dsRNA-binding protein [Firmicutes bacterium]|nr:putative dsRNA-binding protein [Bacillota bacterium]MCL2771237.1 putative dsRNA-binding protein [Bacillota bacterium]
MSKNRKNENERLEWFGDSLLTFFVSRILYEKYPTLTEGELTSKRKNLVSTRILAQATRQLDYVVTGLKEKSEKQLADIFEMELATVYFEEGLDAAESFVVKNLIKKFETVASRIVDYKTVLQEKLQQNGTVKISYETYETEESIRINIAEKTYFSIVLIGKKVLGEGTGRSKKDAEQNAARSALKTLAK